VTGDRVRTPASGAVRAHVAEALGQTGDERDRLLALEVPSAPAGVPLGIGWSRVEPPAGADHPGVGDELLVDRAAVAPDGGVDWWLACFAHLSGAFEQRAEMERGPVHSYAVRLPDHPADLHSRAWANRIGNLLRLMAGLPVRGPGESRVHLTLDLDALRKTWAIRLKQSAFEAVNAAREAGRRRPGGAIRQLWRSARFAVSRAGYENSARIAGLVRELGAGAGTVFVPGRPPGRPWNARDWLFDPGYRRDDPLLPAVLDRYRGAGFGLGLHPCFGTWRDPARLAEERRELGVVLGSDPVACRQHWLRFSWRETWRAQAEAGFTLDSTLGFNDRSGFRAGAALRYRPWDFERGEPHGVEALPLVLMDSHVCAYQVLDRARRRAEMARVLGEVAEVGGEAAVLWHPHTLASDYGWGDSFEDLLDVIVGLDRG